MNFSIVTASHVGRYCKQIANAFCSSSICSHVRCGGDMSNTSSNISPIPATNAAKYLLFIFNIFQFAHVGFLIRIARITAWHKRRLAFVLRNVTGLA